MKILIIRFNALGDVLLTSALADTLRHSLPKAEIHFLTYAPYHPLVCTRLDANESADQSRLLIKSKSRSLITADNA